MLAGAQHLCLSAELPNLLVSCVLPLWVVSLPKKGSPHGPSGSSQVTFHVPPHEFSVTSRISSSLIPVQMQAHFMEQCLPKDQIGSRTRYLLCSASYSTYLAVFTLKISSDAPHWGCSTMITYISLFFMSQKHPTSQVWLPCMLSWFEIVPLLTIVISFRV